MKEEKLQVKLFPNSEPHKYQKEFLYYSNHKDYRYLVLTFPRQQGKTEVLLAAVTSQMLKNPGIKVLWITPVESQGILQFEKLSVALNPFIANGGEKRTHGQFEITLKNTSKIFFKSSSSQSIRGMTINIIIADEFQDILAEDYNANIAPVLVANKNPRVWVAGTPKGVTSNFYQWYRRESLGYKGYKTIYMTEWLNPKTNIEYIEQQKEVIPLKQWLAEYKAQWVSGDGFFSNIPDQNLMEEQFEGIEGIKHYGGVDIGILNDRTCISVVNEFGEQVHCKVLKNTNSPEIKSYIRQIQKDFKVVYWCIEKDGQGLPIIQDLILDEDNEMEFYNIEMVKAKTEKPIILNAIEVKLAKKSIKLINRQDIIDEFADFERRLQPNGSYIYGNGSASRHDDIVIATALSYYCLDIHHAKGEYDSIVI